MQFVRRNIKLFAVGASCVAIGGAASAIATAGAASSSASATSSPGTTARHHHRLLARAVHGDLVVATKNGFVNVTFDRGEVKSVSGQQLTLREGTKNATYKIVTLTIPGNARVRDNKQKASLSDLKAGQVAIVVQGPNHTLVAAHDPRTP